jgi:hypothetical protein
VKKLLLAEKLQWELSKIILHAQCWLICAKTLINLFFIGTLIFCLNKFQYVSGWCYLFLHIITSVDLHSDIYLLPIYINRCWQLIIWSLCWVHNTDLGCSFSSVVSDYGLGTGIRSPTEAEDFASTICIQTGSGAHPASCTMGTGGSFPRGKAQLGHDADHSPPSSTEGKKEWELYLLSHQAPPWRVVGQL